jgi:hypothetical protein
MRLGTDLDKPVVQPAGEPTGVARADAPALGQGGGQ